MRSVLAFSLALALAACGAPQTPPASVASTPEPTAAAPSPSYYGTLDPFASEAVYFVVTDRFVNGDPDNDQREQGGARPTFDIPLPPCDGVVGNIGYLGGDFRGLLDQADYIREMGFTAVWITPIVENPDEAFQGGDPITCTSFLTDRGKAGYHGYWGTNFYRLDEHLPSPGLDFRALTAGLREKGLKTVLDIVGNHGSPAFSMPEPQPGFGQVFDADGSLIADHQNLHPNALDPAGNPLHAFYNTTPDLAQLGDFNADNPAVMDYVVGSTLQWLEQGAHALRIDTIRHQPFGFWKAFAERVREQHPGLFMFGEAFDYEAANIAPFTWPENGGVSLLDFPLKKALAEVLEGEGAGFERLVPALNLVDGPFQNPYELTTFYDNHDMPRLNARDEGFIDAHHWLFTARGIPVVYYGSEMGFMRGRAEHAGNRAYFGSEGVEAARAHPIRAALARVAALRQGSIALQRGLQLNLRLQGDEAVFYRVYQHEGVAQTALVLINKGDAPRTMAVSEYLEPGTWREPPDKRGLVLQDRLEVEVPAHGLRVFLLDAPIQRADTLQRLGALMQRKTARR